MNVALGVLLGIGLAAVVVAVWRLIHAPQWAQPTRRTTDKSRSPWVGTPTGSFVGERTARRTTAGSTSSPNLEHG